MMVLVDTSVWVDHFRRSNVVLAELMVLDRVLTHPFVLGELACGTPPAPRRRTLADIASLLPAQQAAPDEVRDFIEREKLFGLGCGLIDLTLLACTRMTGGAQLWTLDKRLAALAARYAVCFVPSMH